MKPSVVGLGVLVAVLEACSTSPAPEFDRVARDIEQRSGARPHWYGREAGDDAATARVRALLAGELDVDGAVQVALLNNRQLQARYEDLGIGTADLVQAGLLSNPTLSGSIGFPDRPPTGTKLGADFAFELLDLLLRPDRVHQAELALERTRLDVTGEVLERIADVRRHGYHLMAAMQRAAVLGQLGLASASAAELARRQHAAGNINDLELATHEALDAETRLGLLRNELLVRTEREALNRLMGVWGTDTAWRFVGRLPELPPSDPPPDALERLGVERRPDLAGARSEAAAAKAALVSAQRWRWLGRTSVGGEVERDTDGQITAGPTLSLELPIFDQKQAVLARHEAVYRQRVREAEALAITVRSEVRAARDQMLGARQVAEHYRTVLLPLRRQIVEGTQGHYNFMLLGVYELLDSKRRELESYERYVDAVRDYWLARTELERAVGVRLDAPPSEPRAANDASARPTPPSPPSGAHH